MDMNGYALEVMAHERLEDLRAAAVAHMLRARRRTPLRVVVGQALIRLGNRLLGGFTAVQAPARS